MRKKITLIIIMAFQIPVMNNNAATSCIVDNHDISFNLMKNLTTDFLSHYQTEATNAAFGGFIAKQSILFPSPLDLSHSVGLKYFLCAKLDKDTTKLSSIYIAYRCVNDFVKTSPSFAVDPTGDYYKSNGSYKYTSNSFTAGADSAFIESYTATTTMNNTIKGSEVYADMGHFKGHFKNDVQYLGGFFLNVEVAAMMNQKTDLKGIRFVFGYDSSDSQKIKVLLSGVDNGGKNLIKNTGSSYYIMMERAWPPSSN